MARTISAGFKRAASRWPERTAASADGVEIDYRHLGAAVDDLAVALTGALGHGHEPVAIMIGHNTSVLVAILGVMQAGKAYAVLEPDMPEARLRTILSDLGARAVVSVGAHADQAAGLAHSERVVNLDSLTPASARRSGSPRISADSLAAIYYTSGSTGQPKGVQWSHRAIMHRIRSDTRDYGIGSGDKIALLFSCSFGASATNIFNAMLNGASVRLYDVRNSDLRGFSQWLNRESITRLHLPVALFQQWLGSLETYDYFPALCQVIPAGRLYRKDVERLWRHVPDQCSVLHRFSASETGMCTRMVINRDTVLSGTVVPIGRQVPGRQVHLTDDHGRPAAAGEVGEIVVTGRDLSTGYWNAPELTARKFRSDPDNPKLRTFYTGDLGRLRPDGALQYVGRKDFMVKIRGYRVEPSEIEVAIAELDEVCHAAVVDCTAADTETVLVAYVVPEASRTVRCQSVMRHLRQRLPQYMIPAAIMVLNRLPLTASGKVDRGALPMPNLTVSSAAKVAPRNELERILVDIWEASFGLHPIGIEDDFFELGGHSLQALRIASEIDKRCGRRLAMSQLFITPTIAALAQAFDGHASNLPP